ERVVDDEQRPGGAGCARGGREVGQAQGRVRGGLDEEEPGRLGERRREGRLVPRVDEVGPDAELGEYLTQETDGPSVDRLRDDDALTRAQQREEERGRRGEAGRV